MKAFYNDNDAYCCAWLSNLMDAGLITPGRIDDRSIADISPDDVRGYERVHWFAGLGGWEYALNLAGWGDRPVWTGSPPCQPFSTAGKSAGHGDERHLWPTLSTIIRERKPPIIFGEQVARAIGMGWLDAVAADLEAQAYSFGSAVLPACAVGAPHIRNRVWFVAYSQQQAGGFPIRRGEQCLVAQGWADSNAGCADVAHAKRSDLRQQPRRGNGSSGAGEVQLGAHGSSRSVAYADDGRCQGERLKEYLAEQGSPGHFPNRRRAPGRWKRTHVADARAPGQRSHSAIAGSDWWAAEPDVGRVAHGIPARVDKLRAIGNSIVPALAAQFIQAVMDIEPQEV